MSNQERRLAVFALDVGSAKPKSKRKGSGLGWAFVERVGDRVVDTAGASTGTAVEDLISAMEAAKARGADVTLGVEAPLWIPMPTSVEGLSRGRDKEEDRSCLAPSGGYVALLGLQQLTFIVSKLSGWSFTLDHTAWRTDRSRTLIWEAFVVGKAKGKDHVGDAQAAVDAFWRWHDGTIAGGEVGVVLRAGEKALSLAGFALQWTGHVCGRDAPTLVLHPILRRAPADVGPLVGGVVSKS